MATTRLLRTIRAPVNVVFETVAHIESYRQAIPHITGVEFLTEQQEGVGTQFRETRVMRGREGKTDLEVTEYVANERVRLVSDAGGTVWDTLFTTTGDDRMTTLEMTMEAKAHKLSARVMNSLISRMIAKELESDMDAVKTWCEHQSDRDGVAEETDG